MSRGLIARITFGSLALLMVAGLFEYRTSAFPSRPLSKNELLPLVAGNVLPENVAFFSGQKAHIWWATSPPKLRLFGNLAVQEMQQSWSSARKPSLPRKMQTESRRVGTPFAPDPPR
jgi:hypothetical protein